MVRLSDALGAAAAASAASVTKFYPYEPRHGLPAVNVLYTSDQGQALNFLNNRMNTSVLGLDMQWRPFVVSQNLNKHAYSRSTVLRIAAGEWVLIFDLLPEPWLNRPPRPLSEKFCGFLSAENRTFYGMGLQADAARLAFELNCVIRKGVDLARKPWSSMDTSLSLVRLGSKELKTEVPDVKRVKLSDWEWRPLTWPQMHHMVEHIYLTWAVADHFLKRNGEAKKTSVVTKVQMYRSGVRLRRQGMTVRKTRYNWSRTAEVCRERRQLLRERHAGADAKKRTSDGVEAYDDEELDEEAEQDDEDADVMEEETKRKWSQEDEDEETEGTDESEFSEDESTEDDSDHIGYEGGVRYIADTSEYAYEMDDRWA